MTLGNTNLFIVENLGKELILYNRTGNIQWKCPDSGYNTKISPNDKYIATIDYNNVDAYGKGLFVYDMNGKVLWNYNSERRMKVKFITDEILFYVTAPGWIYNRKIGKRERKSGEAIVFKASTGEILYEEEFDFEKSILDIEYIEEYDVENNSIKVNFSPYQRTKIFNFPDLYAIR